MLLAIRKQSGGGVVNIIPCRSFSSGVVYARKHVVREAAGTGVWVSAFAKPLKPHQQVLGSFLLIVTQ